MLYTYEVGKPFPHPEQKAPGIEQPRVMVTSGFFDVLFYSLNPQADKATFTKKPLRYGVYQQDAIPFFIVDFPGDFNFDVSININKVDNKHIDEWLNSDNNLVTLYLIDARTNIIHGIRAIGLKHEVAEQIRDICEKQDEHYASVGHVDIVINRITTTFSTGDMIKRTMMYRL